MKRVVSVGLGALVATSVYGVEPSLQITQDLGSAFVQENADKALKVAYMVAGKMCKIGESKEQGIVNVPGGAGQTYLANLLFEEDGKVYGTTIFDVLNNTSKSTDNLMIMLYRDGVTLQKAKGGFAGSIQLMDQGLDGHVNSGMDGMTSFGRQYMETNQSKGHALGKEHESYFQELYISALDTIIKACEGTQ